MVFLLVSVETASRCINKHSLGQREGIQCESGIEVGTLEDLVL